MMSSPLLVDHYCKKFSQDPPAASGGHVQLEKDVADYSLFDFGVMLMPSSNME